MRRVYADNMVKPRHGGNRETGSIPQRCVGCAMLKKAAGKAMTNTPVAGALAFGLYVCDNADIPPILGGITALVIGFLIGRIMTHGKA